MAALGASVASFVILDGDLRSPQAVNLEAAPVRASGAQVHVWARRELENYLLSPRAVARVSGISNDEATALLEECLESLSEDARATLQAQRLEERRLDVGGTRGLSETTVLRNAAREFAEWWATLESKLHVVDSKALIRALNSKLQERSAKTLNAHKLAKEIPLDDLAPEIMSTLRDLELMVASQ